MSDCKHEDFEARVEVTRIADDGSGENPHSFHADVTVVCAHCRAPFGFKGPPGGLSWSEPRCSPDALSITLPLMSPAELELAGPLPVLARGPMVYEAHP